MTLLLGTPAGLYVAPDGDTANADLALEVPVRRIRQFEGHGVLAATDDGVYQSVGGREWARIAEFGTPVASILGTPDGRIFAGTRPTQLHRSDDGGTSWRALGLDSVPDSGRWADRSFRDGAAVRTLASHPNHSDRLFAGIEPGGVVVSEDGGRSWERRSEGCHDDVHHLLALGPDELLASTGNGVYLTTDAGETWLRQDTDFREFWFNYHREAAVQEGTLYTAARAWGPEEPDAVLLEHDGSDPFGAPCRVEHPGSPDEFVCSFASHMGRLLAGTMRQGDGFGPEDPARVLIREPDGEWRTLGEAPAGVTSLVGL